MPRPSLAVAVLAASCALATAPRIARGQTCEAGTPMLDYELPDGQGDFQVPQPEELVQFFNLANCTCGTEFAAVLQITSGVDSFNEPGDIWVGTDCDQVAEQTTREAQCQKVHTYSDVVSDLRAEVKLAINSKSLMWPNETTCQADQVTRQVHLLVDDDSPNDTTWLCSYKKDIAVDTDPPPTPPSITVNGGESSLVVEWDLPTSGADDIDEVQFLCARADGSTSDNDSFGGIDADFVTAQQVCGSDDGITSGLPGELPLPLLNLDPAALCGSADGTETQARLTGAENGVEYAVVMVTIDKARNGSAVFAGYASPAPVKDFWEDYKDEGGGANGGVCLINSTYGPDHPISHALRDFRDGALARAPFGAELTALYYRAGAPAAELIDAHPSLRPVAQLLLLPLVAIALVWQHIGLAGMLVLVLGLALWRRANHAPRARHKLALAGATAAVLLAAAGPALAQSGGYDPYWEAWEDEDAPAGPATPYWNIELKMGPYLPAIDSEFDLMEGEKGPFETTFRGKGLLLFGLELQRFFFFPEGQLGATFSAGFMGRSTNAFQVDAAGNVVIGADGEPERAPGNKTRFRMIPMSLGAVYRFTMLDDRWRIPLVPYGKAGLSYYLWYVIEPNGGFARAQKDPACDPNATTCETTRGLGASIGFQGSIGLSLRAERLDPNAASNLRNEMGIEHAGFFAELLYAKVDHFGASDRLAVGDFTWLAGINFEF